VPQHDPREALGVFELKVVVGRQPCRGDVRLLAGQGGQVSSSTSVPCPPKSRTAMLTPSPVTVRSVGAAVVSVGISGDGLGGRRADRRRILDSASFLAAQLGTWPWSAGRRCSEAPRGVVGVSRFVTRFGSLGSFEKGRVEVVDDDPRHYAFSNMFEVASRSAPWEQVAVGQNRQYVLEVLRAEGTSGWRICGHDQSALVMDGRLVVELAEPGPDQQPPAGQDGSIGLPGGGSPGGARMGRVTAGRGHLVLLPAGACYRMAAEAPGVVLVQTIGGRDTRYRWEQICQTS
jgi:hypothetical protein